MKVSEFAKCSGINVETVRFYHREGLLKIPETDGTYRNYTSEHLENIAFIKKARIAGFTLEEIKQLERLDAMSDKSEIHSMSKLKLQLLDEKIKELQSAKCFLSELVEACENSDNEPCPILGNLKKQESGLVP